MRFSWKLGLSAFVVAVVLAASAISAVHNRESRGLRKLSDNFKETRASAEHGNSKAEFELGLMYAKGKGVQRDYAAAALWYAKAAEQGYAKAQFALANLYFQGEGVPRNYSKALSWTEKAAYQGDARAEAGLGYMYSSGAGFRKNYVEAMRWYRKAASQGNVEAEHALGYMYLHGQGVPPDYTKAFHWIEKAARKGDASAEASLGYMYSHGQGVRQDRAAAMRWYRKAAAQGNAAAKQAVDASENGFGRAITTRWFELVTAFMGFIAGSWTLLGGLWPGRTRGWRRNAITLLGICFLADGGLSLYAFSYGDRYSPHLLAFNIARFLFTAVAVLIVVAVVLPAKKTVPHR